jgi:hypothetical protein
MIAFLRALLECVAQWVDAGKSTACLVSDS